MDRPQSPLSDAPTRRSTPLGLGNSPFPNLDPVDKLSDGTQQVSTQDLWTGRLCSRGPSNLSHDEERSVRSRPRRLVHATAPVRKFVRAQQNPVSIFELSASYAQSKPSVKHHAPPSSNAATTLTIEITPTLAEAMDVASSEDDEPCSPQTRHLLQPSDYSPLTNARVSASELLDSFQLESCPTLLARTSRRPSLELDLDCDGC